MTIRSLLPTAAAGVAALAVLAPEAMAAPPTARAAADVEQYAGKVVAMGHAARGRGAVVRRTGGARFVTLSRGFRIDPGPNVRVYLVAGRVRKDSDVKTGKRKNYVDLGKLKGSKGNQQYRIPKGVNVAKYRTVVFWCVPFTQTMARVDLKRS